ncbi:MAG: signal peptidase II [Omnitrophica bacterium]|nr:signal peptidase II [Candidatus Omnitrophota bacterium]
MSVLLGILALLVIDQLTKFIVLNQFQPGESLPVIKNVFHISLVCNKGVAFGLFSEQGAIFAWISFVAVLIMCYTVSCYKKISLFRKSTQVFLSLVLAGAIGNLIDRIRFGCVVDFLDFRIWPVFNVADSAITIGTLLLVLQILKKKTLKH